MNKFFQIAIKQVLRILSLSLAFFLVDLPLPGIEVASPFAALALGTGLWLTFEIFRLSVVRAVSGSDNISSDGVLFILMLTVFLLLTLVFIGCALLVVPQFLTISSPGFAMLYAFCVYVVGAFIALCTDQMVNRFFKR